MAELEKQLARSTEEIGALSRQLHAVQRDPQAERSRSRRAALTSSMASAALAVKGLDGIMRTARPQDQIADEQEMTRELLVTGRPTAAACQPAALRRSRDHGHHGAGGKSAQAA